MDSKNHDSSDVLTAVLDNIAQSMVVIGPDFRVRAFNQRFVDLFQLPAKAFQIGIDFREVLCIWPAETGQDQAMLERAIRELSMPESFVFEFAQGIHGEERWCQLFHNPVPEGGCVWTFSDITDQRKTEESVHHQKNLLSAVLSNMAQGVVDSQVEVGCASGEAVGCPCSRCIRGSHVDLPQGDAELDWYRKNWGRRKVVGATNIGGINRDRGLQHSSCT